MTEIATDKRRHSFFIVDNAVVDSYGLCPQEGWLYCVIVRHINHRTGVAFPSLALLIAQTGMSRPTVIKYLKALVEKGLLRYESGQQTGTANIYELMPIGEGVKAFNTLAVEGVNELYTPIEEGVNDVNSPGAGGVKVFNTPAREGVKELNTLDAKGVNDVDASTGEGVKEVNPNKMLFDDDPESCSSQRNIKQTKRSPTPEEARVLALELDGLGLSAPLRGQVLQEDAERGLALLLHAKGEGRNPAGLLVSMLRRGDDPAPKYVDQAQMKLQPATPLAYQARRSPEPRPEPIGLDEHPGGSALSVRDLWYALLGQLELQLNRATFDTWVKGTVIERYEDGVLWVRPKHLYAREWLEKHLQHLLDESLSRLAGVPVTVRFLGEAAAQAAGG